MFLKLIKLKYNMVVSNQILFLVHCLTSIRVAFSIHAFVLADFISQ